MALPRFRKPSSSALKLKGRERIATSAEPLWRAAKGGGTVPTETKTNALGGATPWAQAIAMAAKAGVAAVSVTATIFVRPLRSLMDLNSGFASMKRRTLSMVNINAFIGTPVIVARMADPIALV